MRASKCALPSRREVAPPIPPFDAVQGHDPPPFPWPGSRRGLSRSSPTGGRLAAKYSPLAVPTETKVSIGCCPNCRRKFVCISLVRATFSTPVRNCSIVIADDEAGNLEKLQDLTGPARFYTYRCST